MSNRWLGSSGGEKSMNTVYHISDTYYLPQTGGASRDSPNI